jgi:hypothetical protein
MTTTSAPTRPLETAPEVVLGLCHRHVTARALQVVADLGVADLVEDCGRTELDLAGPLHADADALGRTLRLLEADGLFRRDQEGRWHNTKASTVLRSDHPRSLRSFVRMTGTPFHWESVQHLDHTVRTGAPGITRLDPAGWLHYLDAHPAEHEIFQQAMTSKAHDDIAAVLAVHDFSRYRTVVDVAGGHGHLITAVLAAFPTVAGVLFELPAVAGGVPPAHRLTVVAGDLFTDPLPAGDAYVLMNVLHDWDDDRAVDVLTRVAKAGRPGATVLVVETVLPEGGEPHYAKTLDVVMLAITGGRERTAGRYRALLEASGLDLAAIVPTATPFSLIEATIR